MSPDNTPIVESKKWYQSKVIWGNVATFLLGLLALVDAQFELGIMKSEVIGIILSLLASFGIYARKVTTKVIK